MPFDFQTIEIPGLFLITPRVFSDERGYFLEAWKQSEFHNFGIREEFVQDNHSLSSRGVLRGLHFQKIPESQGKLVRVITGAVWDVAVDIRRESKNYGQWFGIELSGENHRMVYIPPGFAHGFLTLRDNTHFLYKCTREYSLEYDSGIRWNDNDLSIEWPLDKGVVPEVSSKDQKLPFFKDVLK
ncbi:MAG: dTDP-4-dehydrorhamnose 3,5-epimerase [Spirochaetes bacterium]|nr:MAG: dTDP-4-dehydrorhamnose 3,5-epimerase [Spirochaetota bacterium]